MSRDSYRFRRSRPQSREAGQTAIFFLLVLATFLLGAMALAFDFSHMWFRRQAAQSAADAACAAGAMDLLVDAEGGATGRQGFTNGTPFTCQGKNYPICQYAAKNGYDSGNTFPGNLVSVSFPATVPGVTTPPVSMAPTPFISVTILDHVPTFFWGLLSGGTTADVTASSTCGVELAQSPIPLVVLDPRSGDSKTFSVGGTAGLAIYGGPQQSIEVNSPNVDSAYIQGTVDLSLGGPNSTGSDFGTYGGPAAAPGGFLPGSTGHWFAPDPPLGDPFAQVNAPNVPTVSRSSTTPFNHLAPGVGECPADPSGNWTGGCDVWAPGHYTSNLQVKGPGGTKNMVLSLFIPGIYYIDTGGLSAAANSCIRPSTQDGDGSGGVMFYFADGNSVNVGADSGNKCTNVAAIPAFNTTSGTGSLAYGAKCTATSSIPTNMPSSLSGTVLLGPCRAGTIAGYCDGNCGINFGDPQGTSDPLGEQRGFLFFQNRAQNAGTNPNWQGGGQFLLAGTMYFHQCVTSGTDTGQGCDNASAFNDNLTLAGNPGSSTYILGMIIVDQLTLKGTSTLTMDLNPQTSFSILKASILK